MLLGGVGGRLEHTLANLQSLAWLTTQGARGVLAGEGTVATALHNESMTFPPGAAGLPVRVLLQRRGQGVRLENLKYELNDHTMSADFPLGVSNEFVDAPAKITVGDGTLLALWREQGTSTACCPSCGTGRDCCVAVYGTPTIKRIYGDWTSPNMATWKSILLENAITPIQQYSYTTGKNSTDSAMIIDAMDILLLRQLRRLCAGEQRQRLHPPGHPPAGGRDEGVRHGGEKDPKPFIVACDKFVYIGVVGPGPRRPAAAAPKKGGAPAKKGAKKESKKARPPAALPRRRSWSSSPSRWRTCARRTGCPYGQAGQPPAEKSSPTLIPATTASPSCPN